MIQPRRMISCMQNKRASEHRSRQDEEGRQAGRVECKQDKAYEASAGYSDLVIALHGTDVTRSVNIASQCLCAVTPTPNE